MIKGHICMTSGQIDKIAIMKNLIALLILSTALIFSCTNQEELPTGGTPIPGDPGDGIVNAGIPAFPGAEGFGSETAGGRGGQILEVTNLNDSGPGSFRQLVNVPGPRIIVFKVGGIIKLSKAVEITEPFVTVAGQTAPGDGIMFRDAAFKIQAPEVIVRGIRMRVGDVNKDKDWDGIEVQSKGKEVYNVVVDHCSVSWAIDENFGSIGLMYGLRDITYSYNIISEALHNSHHKDGAHSKGMLLTKNNMSRVSVHHNLFAHNDDRNPKVGLNLTAEVVNNVVYNFASGTRLDPGAHANVISNYYITGEHTPDFQLNMPTRGISIGVRATEAPILGYVKDNIGPGRLTNTGDDWLAVNGDDAQAHRSLTPVADFEQSGITTVPVEQVIDYVLENAGATAPHRDPVDLRVINDVRNGTGSVIDSQSEVGGWPVMNSGTAPTDTDKDGMPDFWESEAGHNPNDASDGRQDTDGDGYTNVEEYLNSFFD